MPDASEADREAIRALGAQPVDFRLDRKGLNPVADLATFVSLWRGLRRQRPDRVLCYFIKPVVYGLWAARLAGVGRRFALIEGAGSVFGEHSGLRRWRWAALRWLVVRLYRVALRQAERVILLNRDDEALFVESGMLRREQSVVLPGIGIDLEAFPAQPQPPRPLTFVMLTRLLRAKGLRQYAAAARQIRTRHPEVRFRLLGGLETGPDAISVARIKQWVNEGVLEWPGRVTDVGAWLADSHVFVLPSYYREGLPRSTLEAMATGRAVITTDSVGCRDTVRHGETGLLVPPRDSEALADAMEQLIDAPDTIARMGAAGRRMAESRFDVRVANRRFMEAMGLPVGVDAG